MDCTAESPGSCPSAPRALHRWLGCLALLALLASCGDAGGPPDVWRDQVHRRSEVPGLGWELVPGIDLEVDGVHVRTSSIGARDDEPIAGDDVFRVAALGGSFTFGLGVEGEASWPRLLERELARSILVMGREVDFLDLAVCGWDASQQLVELEQRGLALDPWLVVLEHTFEDPAAPRVAALRGLAGLAPAATIEEQHDAEQAPWHERSAAWDRVRALCGPRSIPVVVLIVPRLDGSDWASYPYRAQHEEAAREARRRNFEALDLLEWFEGEPPASLVERTPFLAPSERAQALAADAFKRFAFSSGVLTRVLEAH